MVAHARPPRRRAPAAPRGRLQLLGDREARRPIGLRRPGHRHPRQRRGHRHPAPRPLRDAPRRAPPAPSCSTPSTATPGWRATTRTPTGRWAPPITTPPCSPASSRGGTTCRAPTSPGATPPPSPPRPSRRRAPRSISSTPPTRAPRSTSTSPWTGAEVRFEATVAAAERRRPGRRLGRDRPAQPDRAVVRAPAGRALLRPRRAARHRRPPRPALRGWVEEGGIGQGESAPPGPGNPGPNGPDMTHVPVPFFLSTRGYGL